jgi:hypothetical protein
MARQLLVESTKTSRAERSCNPSPTSGEAKVEVTNAQLARAVVAAKDLAKDLMFLTCLE